MRAVVLSLRPRFAQAILEGRKSVELRRHRVAAPPGSRLILYASSPVRAVLGTAWLSHVDTSSAADIWDRHGDRLGLDRQEFEQYLHGAAQASALVLESPHTLSTPLTLTDLRASSPFQPPQSYRYLSVNDPHPLRALPDAEHPVRELWRRLDQRRRNGGHSLHDLAQATGVPASTVHTWFSTRQTAPSYHELMAIVDQFSGSRYEDWPLLWQQAVDADRWLF
jgi:predicted transcriptional regulator